MVLASALLDYEISNIYDCLVASISQCMIQGQRGDVYVRIYVIYIYSTIDILISILIDVLIAA